MSDETQSQAAVAGTGPGDVSTKNEQAAVYKEKWLRACADYQNLQKDVERRRQEWMQMSEFQVLADFLPVYEHLKKSLVHAPEDAAVPGELSAQMENWKKGVSLSVKQFGDILAAHGVAEITPAPGSAFDPACHEAVGEEPSAAHVAGTIARVVEGGYEVGKRVVRPAKVVLAGDEHRGEQT